MHALSSIIRRRLLGLSCLLVVATLAALTPCAAFAADAAADTDADDAAPLADDVKQARALIDEGHHEKAMDLLAENITDRRMAAEPAFMLALADAAIGHAPTIPILNGGDTLQRNLYREAGKLYRRVRDLDAATNAQKVHAITAINRVLRALDKRINKAWETETWGEILFVAEHLIAFEPAGIFGPEAILDLADELDDPKLRLYGMRRFVQIKPKAAEHYTFAAMLEVDQDTDGGGAQAALAHIDLGLTVLPDDLGLQIQRVRYLTDLQRNEDALAAAERFEQTLTKRFDDPKDRALYLAVAGKMHEDLGRANDAETRYRQAIRARPDLVQARYLLGTMLFDRGIQSLLQAMKLDGKEPERFDALLKSGKANLADARPHLEYVHQNADPDLTVMNALATIYERTGEVAAFMEMRRDIRKVQNGEPIR
ncbi:MAG: hypothetical protein ACPGYV_14245 [Phycisphaeraceae bacterium]